MQEMQLDSGKTRKPILEKTLNIIGTVSLIAAALYAALIRVDVEAFILITIVLIINLCIKPLIEYIKEASQGEIGKSFPTALKLGFLTTLMVGGLFVIHKAIFSQAIIQDKNYETYNFLAECIIISAIAMQIINTIKKTRAHVLEGAGFLKHCGNIINLIFTIFFVIIIPVSKFYMPKKVVDFSSIKVPSEFRFLQVSKGKPVSASSMNIVADDKFAKLFQREISMINAENVRDLDKINYEIRDLNGRSYLAIQPHYKETYGNFRSVDGIDDGYIYEIRMYENGEVILQNFDVDNFKPILNKPIDIYRLKLSVDFIDEVKSVIKENLK